MTMIDCCLTISISGVWSVDLVLHKEFIDLLVFNCKKY